MITSLVTWSLIFILGASFGSFASAMAYRIPKNISWTNDRSICPICNHVLTVRDLFPFFSWLLNGGKCRHCKASISIIYPVLELVTGVLALLLFLNLGLSLYTFTLIFSLPFLIALLVIDLRYYILPNILTGILAALAFGFIVIYAVSQFALYDGAQAAFGQYVQLKAAGGVIFWALMSAGLYALLPYGAGKITALILRRPSLGFGDVKLFAVIGLWLGVQVLPIFLILTGVIGVIFGSIWKIKVKTNKFPFGPAIITAFLICVIWIKSAP